MVYTDLSTRRSNREAAWHAGCHSELPEKRSLHPEIYKAAHIREMANTDSFLQMRIIQSPSEVTFSTEAQIAHCVYKQTINISGKVTSRLQLYSWS